MRLNDLTPEQALDLGRRLLAAGVRLDVLDLAYMTPGGARYRPPFAADPDGILDLRDAGTFGHAWEEYERRAGRPSELLNYQGPNGWRLWGVGLRAWPVPGTSPTRAHALVAALEGLAKP